VNRLLLWVAQGFGIGRIPVAPGTFGSLLGLLWFLLLLLAQNIWAYLAGTIIGLGLSVWLCDAGEKILGQKDPGSIVFDEVAAMPVCFLGWIAIVIWKTGSMPTPDFFFARYHWPIMLAVFAGFRFFDVLKPWPVRSSQSLPGGWGVTVDDVLAAVYVNAMVLAAYAGRLMLAG
jgi:phosphatidylglycerophosphatase A